MNSQPQACTPLKLAWPPLVGILAAVALVFRRTGCRQIMYLGMSRRMNCYQLRRLQKGSKMQTEQPLCQRVDNVNTPLAGQTHGVRTLPGPKEAANE